MLMLLKRPRGKQVTLPVASLVMIALLSPAARGQKAEIPTRASIEADYKQAQAQADRDYIARLTALAESQTGADAEATYLEIFRFVVGSDRFGEAEKAAERIIAAGTKSPEVTFLAHLINILSEADRGQYEEAVRDLRAFVNSPVHQGARNPEERSQTALAVGEAFVRRLIKQSRFDDAMTVSKFIAKESRTPAIRDHFENYVRRLQQVGKPAPGIEGRNIDGEPDGLGKLKGKVVLVVFWATWCPPCIENLPRLREVSERFEDDGFTVLGVNVDEGTDRENLARKFVVDFAISWPNILNAKGESDFASVYGVKEIPASVLIGRDGRVITFDLSLDGLAETVATAVQR